MPSPLTPLADTSLRPSDREALRHQFSSAPPDPIGALDDDGSGSHNMLEEEQVSVIFSSLRPGTPLPQLCRLYAALLRVERATVVTADEKNWGVMAESLAEDFKQSGNLLAIALSRQHQPTLFHRLEGILSIPDGIGDFGTAAMVHYREDDTEPSAIVLTVAESPASEVQVRLAGVMAHHLGHQLGERSYIYELDTEEET